MAMTTMEKKDEAMQFRTMTKAVAGLLLGTVMAAGAVHADAPKKDWTISGGVAITTDYVFRGVSQNAERPAVQANLDATYKMFYAGIFFSNVDFTGNVPGTSVGNVEIDYYAGIKFPVGKVEADVGVIYYSYPGANDSFAVTGFKELDYVELKAGAKYKPVDPLTLGLFVYWSPEGTNKTGSVFTFEGSAEYVLPKLGSITPTIGALLGYQIGDSDRYKLVIANGDTDYVYWNAGINLGFHDNFSIDLRYWDTNIKNSAAGFSGNFCNGPAAQCNERFVATAKVTF